jgi:hypothetical protein
MSLEDGRMLISADRYDKLKKTHSKYYYLSQWHRRVNQEKANPNARIVHNREDFRRLGLVKVHPNFRVIALGLPVLYLVQWP